MIFFLFFTHPALCFSYTRRSVFHTHGALFFMNNAVCFPFTLRSVFPTHGTLFFILTKLCFPYTGRSVFHTRGFSTFISCTLYGRFPSAYTWICFPYKNSTGFQELTLRSDFHVHNHQFSSTYTCGPFFMSLYRTGFQALLLRPVFQVLYDRFRMNTTAGLQATVCFSLNYSTGFHAHTNTSVCFSCSLQRTSFFTYTQPSASPPPT